MEQNTSHISARDWEALEKKLADFERRLLVLEIVVRGEDGRSGMKAKPTELCQRFDAFEQKAIRRISIGTSLPGIVVGVVAVLSFLGKASRSGMG
jgi:hypothetical protein